MKTEYIDKVIDDCLATNQTSYSSSLRVRCRRGNLSCNVDKQSISHYFNSKSKNLNNKVNVSSFYPPNTFCLILEEKQDNTINGIAIWYIGYSTWKGKVMNLDTLCTCSYDDNNLDDSYEHILINALIHIAQCLDFNRIVYQVQGKKESQLFQEKFHHYNFQLLHEWLTLEMKKEQIVSFLEDDKYTLKLQQKEEQDNDDDTIMSMDKDAIKILQVINAKIDHILCQMNKTPIMNKHFLMKSNEQYTYHSTMKSTDERCASSSFQLRRALFQDNRDAKAILKLVNGLALYENSLDEVFVNETIYRIDGSDSEDNPLYHCILLEEVVLTKALNDDDNNANSIVVGMGFFYFGYSMKYNGKYLYLEDLFIEEKYRGNGFGTAIMNVLAGISKVTGCERFVWQALDWNVSALNFYNSIGANCCEGLMTLRLDKDQIMSFLLEKSK